VPFKSKTRESAENQNEGHRCPNSDCLVFVIKNVKCPICTVKIFCFILFFSIKKVSKEKPGLKYPTPSPCIPFIEALFGFQFDSTLRAKFCWWDYNKASRRQHTSD